MGETLLDVDAARLRAAASAVRAVSTGLDRAGTELTGLRSVGVGSVPPGQGPLLYTAPSAALREAAARAESTHTALIAAVRGRVDEVSRAMAQAADSYAHHETHLAHVLLTAVQG